MTCRNLCQHLCFRNLEWNFPTFLTKVLVLLTTECLCFCFDAFLEEMIVAHTSILIFFEICYSREEFIFTILHDGGLWKGKIIDASSANNEIVLKVPEMTDKMVFMNENAFLRCCQ